MTHAEVRARLGDYIEGDLPLARRALVDAHLEACADCATTSARAADHGRCRPGAGGSGAAAAPGGVGARADRRRRRTPQCAAAVRGCGSPGWPPAGAPYPPSPWPRPRCCSSGSGRRGWGPSRFRRSRTSSRSGAIRWELRRPTSQELLELPYAGPTQLWRSPTTSSGRGGILPGSCRPRRRRTRPGAAHGSRPWHGRQGAAKT